MAVEKGDVVPPKWAGLKFFNVYGANEYHKGAMRSVIAANYERIKNGEPLRLFRSYQADFPDGGLMRDFVYVSDCVEIVFWMLDNSFESSVDKAGSGKARSWLDLGCATFAAMEPPERIEFVDMLQALRGRYQYLTEVPIEKMRAAWCLHVT
jgi:ADP-L-glycero-D-manno-heptose 6-epimerase